MTDGETWDAIVADWQAAHDAVVAFPLFKGGMMQNALLGEFERLRATELAARDRMDSFIQTHRS
jgi:hypothetical protein